jgi:hypothetical protein
MTQATADRSNDSAHDTTHAGSHRRRSTGAAAFLLVGSAFALWGAAAAAVLMPRSMPEFAWIFKHAAKHGLTVGPLALCGMCLWGLALVVRTVARTRGDEQADESKERLRFDQLSGALTLVRDRVESSQALIARVQEIAQSALEIAQSEQSNAAAQNRQDAIFRLAASLDQVGAHLDQRLQAQQAAVENMLQETTKSLVATRDEIKQLASSRASSAPSNEIVGRAIDMKRSSSLRSTGADAFETSLGVLDTLDDFGVAQEAGNRTLSLREGPTGENPTAPLPRDASRPESGSNARRLSNGASERAQLGEGDEFSTRDKLELLRALMDDVRVREALGGLTGVGS